MSKVYFYISFVFFIALDPILEAVENKFNPEEASINKNFHSLSNKNSKKNENLDFESDNISYDAKNQTIIATGNVVFKTDTQTLKADQVFFNTSNDILYAKGNIEIIDTDGNRIYGKNILSDPKLKTAIMTKFNTIFTDNSSLIAEEVSKKNEADHVLEESCFTACKVAKKITPTWSINSKKAVYNSANQDVKLYNSWFKVKDVPIFWIPYYSFSNLDFVRKIGFLTPDYTFNSIYGASAIIPFYVPLGQHQDLTITSYIFLKNAPLINVQYNGFIKNGSFSVDSSFVKKQISSRPVDEKSRWHYFANYKKNINNTFRITSNIEQVSDDSYLDMYSISNKDSAESFFISNVILEGFLSKNSYLNINIYEYNPINDIFINQNNFIFTKNISFIYDYFSDFTKFGRLNYSTNVTTFFNNSNEGLARAHVKGEYKYSFVNMFGRYSAETLGQTTFYKGFTDNTDIIKDNYSSAVGAAATWEYSIFFNDKYFTYTLAPISQIAFLRNINDNNNDNIILDSADINLTANNLFDLNHYAGSSLFEESVDFKSALYFSFLNEKNLGGRIFIGKIFRNVDYHNLSDLNIDSSNNYFISTALSPHKSFTFSYNGIVNKDFEIIETTISSLYHNDLFRIGLSYNGYFNLDPEYFSDTTISELDLSGSININENYKATVSSLFEVAPKTIDIKSLNFNLSWSDECLELIFYINQDYYARSVANSFGFKINIRTIDNYEFLG